ncbi:MAG: hypothetical protein H8E26_14125 [FCB group bacterium]|nr:hypothetical protein [FCB group bacterium]MBL7027421.1 hypothetical protein [Candidatus Neomarinimicrobiota bacterium]MBL7122597.1 hypothetical protein [Candidatus Neomarinimicrobiota bacterium]
MRLHAHSLKIDEAGAAVATAVDLTAEGATVDVDPIILEEMGSKSSLPVKRIDLGAKIELKAVALTDSLGELGDQLNSEDAAMKVEATRVKVLDLFDAQFTVEKSDGTSETWKVTNMNYSGKLSQAFKHKEKVYVPIHLLATATSELTVVVPI